MRWKICCRFVDTLGNYSLEMLQGLGASPVHKACEHFYNMCPAGTSCWEGIQTALRRWHPFRKPPRKGNLHTLAYNEKKKKDTLKGVPLLNKSRLPDVCSNFKVTRKKNLFKCQDCLSGDIAIHIQTATTDSGRITCKPQES